HQSEPPGESVAARAVQRRRRAARHGLSGGRSRSATMNDGIRSIATKSPNTAAAVADLLEQLTGFEPVVISFFAAHHHDGDAIANSLKVRFPSAQVTGCTT